MPLAGTLGTANSRLGYIVLAHVEEGNVWQEIGRPTTWQEAGRMPTFQELNRPVTWSAPTMTALVKRAAETRLYTMDLSLLSEIVGGDTVASVTSVSQFIAASGLVSTDLTITSIAVAAGNKGVQCKIAGGTDGVQYLLSFKVLTTNGYTLIGIGYLYIDDR